MRGLTNDDSHAELGRTDHRNCARSQIPDVNRPWITLKIQLGRSRGQIDYRWRIEKFKPLSTKVNSNRAAVRLQVNHRLVLQSVLLTDEQGQTDEKCFHKSLFELLFARPAMRRPHTSTRAVPLPAAFSSGESSGPSSDPCPSTTDRARRFLLHASGRRQSAFVSYY